MAEEREKKFKQYEIPIQMGEQEEPVTAVDVRRIVDNELRINPAYSELLTYTFYEDIVASGTGKGIPKTIVADRDCTILEVYIKVETAPGGSDTITVDVNKGGTTIFTTQGNRPSITGSGTTDTSGTPDIVSLAKNDEITMDIDTAEGSVAKLSVYVRCRKDIL